MKISLLTHGTRGDVQPFVSLALALTERGHDVVLGTPVNLVSFVEKCGVRVSKLAIDSQAFLQSPEGRRWLSCGNVQTFMKEMGALFTAHRDELMEDYERACADAELLITGILSEDYVCTLAEARKLPAVVVHFNPMRPNERYSNSLVTTAELPGFLNRATGSLAEMAWWGSYRDNVNVFRQRLGLPRTNKSTPRRLLEMGFPTVHAFSPTIVPPPRSYRDTPVVGTIRFPDSARARLDESVRDEPLQAWLSAGTPPIFLGLGSMPVENPTAMLQSLDKITRALGVRALVGAGWSSFAKEARVPDAVRILGAVDHGWLLPQCRAAVHHGGAGTVVAALTAGRPAVVCSVFADQPFWGVRIERLGAGVHLPYKNLNETSLTDALRRVLDPAMKVTAERLGAAVQAEPDATPMIVERALAQARGRVRSAGS